MLFVAIFSLHFDVSAQSGRPIKVAIGNEATAIPFTVLPTQTLHPCIQLGTEFIYKYGTRGVKYQTVNLGYMYHQYLFQGVYFNSEFGYDLFLSKHMSLKTNMGLGYLHTFGTRTEYQLANGVYKAGTDKGNARVMPSFSLGLGYRLKKEMTQSPEFFILYKSWVEYPYSPGFIPVMTHVNIEMGVKINLKHHRHED